MPVLNWVNFGGPVSWDQANAVAQAAGGRLLVDDHAFSPGANWYEELADSIDQVERHEQASWFGISAVAGGGYRFVNGATVDPAWAAIRFDGFGDPNADADKTNDTLHPVINGSEWRSPAEVAPDGVSQALIEYTDSKSVRGTAYNDAFFGGAGPGEVLRMGAGDDTWSGTGGGKIYAGPGKDLVLVRELEFTNPWVTGNVQDGTIVYDDDKDSDVVDVQAGVVKAVLAGDDGYTALRVSYAGQQGHVEVAPTTDPEAGPFLVTATDALGAVSHDHVDANEIVGADGDDHIEAVSRIQGGDGNDYLAPGVSHWSSEPYAQGDAGDDTLVASTAERTELRGGAGDDLLLLGGPAEVSGGAGADRFVFRSTGPVTIVDFSATDDTLDFGNLVDKSPEQLFDEGYLKVQRAGGYTRLLFDADGGGDHFALLASLKGVFTQQQIEDRLAGSAAAEDDQLAGVGPQAASRASAGDTFAMV